MTGSYSVEIYLEPVVKFMGIKYSNTSQALQKYSQRAKVLVHPERKIDDTAAS